MKILTTSFTPTELAAVRAVVESDLKSYGSVLEAARPELYQALVSAKTKLANLAHAREAVISA